jgi:hypothetical protein
MENYDPKKVRSLINSATAHSRLPGGELAVQLAKQLEAVDGMIASSQQATVTAQQATRLAQQDLQIANDELRQAREKVAPLGIFTEALTSIAKNAKGAKELAKKTLESVGIKIEAAPTTPPTA